MKLYTGKPVTWCTPLGSSRPARIVSVHRNQVVFDYLSLQGGVRTKIGDAYTKFEEPDQEALDVIERCIPHPEELAHA